MLGWSVNVATQIKIFWPSSFTPCNAVFSPIYWWLMTFSIQCGQMIGLFSDLRSWWLFECLQALTLDPCTTDYLWDWRIHHLCKISISAFPGCLWMKWDWNGTVLVDPIWCIWSRIGDLWVSSLWIGTQSKHIWKGGKLLTLQFQRNPLVLTCVLVYCPCNREDHKH